MTEPVDHRAASEQWLAEAEYRDSQRHIDREPDDTAAAALIAIAHALLTEPPSRAPVQISGGTFGGQPGTGVTINMPAGSQSAADAVIRSLDPRSRT